MQDSAFQEFCLKTQRRSMEEVLKKLAAKGSDAERVKPNSER
jgi:hypothetical protein